MIKHVSVFTLKDKMEIDHFITLLEEVGNDLFPFYYFIRRSRK